MTELGENRYGKSAIRVVRVFRDGERHGLRDLTVSVALEGDFAAAHVEGDNANVLTTDTMKNTVYAFALDRLSGSIEDYGRALAEHFVAQPHVERADVAIRERPWQRIADAGTAFRRDGSLVRTATVVARRALEAGDSAPSVAVEAGIDELVVMMTARSSFAGFPRDRYTSLRETDDRLLATAISATWRYARPDVGHDAAWSAALDALLGAFADHDSASVQASIFVMGHAMLDRVPVIEWITFRLPNLHHWTVDLAPFGLENDDAVYVATTEPHGLIEATVRRTH